MPACTDEEAHSHPESAQASSSDQRQCPAGSLSDHNSSSGDGGLWQKSNDTEQQQQQSTTGTWDFETNPKQEAAQPSSSASSQDTRDKQMLYIQMEFCPRTLKKILVAGPIEEEAAWQVINSESSHMQHCHKDVMFIAHLFEDTTDVHASRCTLGGKEG